MLQFLGEKPRGVRLLLKVTQGLFRSKKLSARQSSTADPLLAFSSEDAPATERTPSVAGASRHARNVVGVVVVTLLVVAAAVVVVPLRLMAGRSAVPELGRLAVTTEPPGVSVFIDGAARGATPLSIDLPQGSHTMMLQHGDERKPIPLTIKTGEQVSQYFEFAPTALIAAASTGSLSVAIDRGSAQVLVDGSARGSTPLNLRELAAGDHSVAIVSDAGTSERRVHVEAGATATVLFSTPAPVGATAGWLAVSSPFEVQVMQGNDLVGSSAAPRIMLPTGRHELRMVSPALGFSEVHKVEVVAGKTATIRVAAPSASVSINARPWADVDVDGASLGQTPLANVSLPIGQHQVAFHHPQLGERRQSFVVTAMGPNRVSADLTKQ